jgi:hypothetical protein
MTSIVVPSFDNYRDLWPLWYESFQLAWPDCPYPVYFITNGAPAPHPSLKTVNVGEDKGWSNNLIKALPEIPGETILMMLEDLFLAKRVNTERVRELINWAEGADARYLKLQPVLHLHRYLNADVYEMLVDEPYWTSTVMSLWQRDTLASILRPDESAWDFEIKGTARAKALGARGFYATTANHLPIINGVIRRVWNPSSIRALRALGLHPDLNARSAMSRRDHLVWAAKAVLFNIWIAGEVLKTLFKSRAQIRLPARD